MVMVRTKDEAGGSSGARSVESEAPDGIPPWAMNKEWDGRGVSYRDSEVAGRT